MLHYKSILNETSSLSKKNQQRYINNNNNQQSLSEYKQSYSRKLFKSIFCIGTSCRNDELIESMEKQYNSIQQQSSIPQPMSRNKSRQKVILDIKKALKNHSETIHFMTNNDYQTLPAIMVLSSMSLMTQKKSVQDSCNEGIFKSETQLEKFCRYLQNKIQKKNIMICQQDPCQKLINAAMETCDYIVVNIEKQPQAQQSLNYLVQQQKYLLKQSDKVKLKQNIPEIIFTQYPKFNNLSQFQKIMIIPYLKCSCYTPDIQQKSVRSYVEKQLKFIYNNYPQFIKNVLLILPSSFSFEELQEMIIHENNAFFSFYENPTWFSRVRNINEYTYIMQRRFMNSNNNSFAKNIGVGKQKLLNQRVYINSAGKEFNFNCNSFQRFVKVKGVFIDDNLEYYMVKFKTISKFEKKKVRLCQWLQEQIFFLDEIQHLTNRQHYFDFLMNLLNQASYMSCLQCINCIHQDQITLESLNNQIIHLRYISVLISSGVIQNEKDLFILQQMFYEVKKIHLLDIQIKEVNHIIRTISSNRQSDKNQDQIPWSKNGSSEFQGYSYDMNSVEKISYLEQVMRCSGQEEFVMTEHCTQETRTTADHARKRILTEVDLTNKQSEFTMHCSHNSNNYENLSVK